MTAIHRREMLGVMLGGAVVATAGLSMSLVPAESAPYCPADRVPNWAPMVPRGVRRRKVCWWWGGGGGDVESAAGAGSRRMAGSGFRPLSIEGARHDHPSDAGDMGAGRPHQDFQSAFQYLASCCWLTLLHETARIWR